MLLDGHSNLFHQGRHKLESLATAFQYTANTPARVYNWGHDNLASRKNLLAENKRLTMQEMRLNAKLAKLYAIENENQQLRALLSSADNTSEKVALAQILSLSLDNSRQLMVINKGAADGVYVGQPVIDAAGVFGQVIDVNPHLAKLMLITDADSRIPVVDSRSHYRSIASGLGSSEDLNLINVLNAADVKVGDVFVTSGLGLTYPAGYPVAKVITIKPIASSGLKQITLQPLAKLNSSSQVLLVWHNQDKLAKQVKGLLADQSYTKHAGVEDESKV